MGKQNRIRQTHLMAGVASVALSLGLMGTALAQDTQAAKPNDDTDTIVVTGFRKSVATSIAVKREAENIVEVVSSEEIGKLPDVSIAESLARLPGLAAQRLDGRAQVISVRGLGPDYTQTLVNGREQVSTGDNRSVEFDQYPSELISSAVVYKSTDAGLIGAGLAGTIDLQTVRPLAYGKRSIALGVRYEKNDLGALNAGSKAEGNRLSASYINQFADGKVGVALGYAHMETPSQNEKFAAWGYPTTNGSIIIGGAKPYVESNLLTRDGYIGIVEFKPNDRFSTSIDAYYSKFENDQLMRGIELPLFWSSAQLQPGFTSTNGVVTSGTYSGVKGVIRNDENKRNNTLKAFGWATKYNIDDHWTLNTDIAYSATDRTDNMIETYAGTGRAGTGATDTLNFTFGSKGIVFTHGLNYADPNLIKLTQSQGWGANASLGIPGGQDGYLNQPKVKDELTSYRAGLTRDLKVSFINSVEFGVNFSDRQKSKSADEWFLGLKGNPANVSIPASALLSPTSLSYLGLGNMVSYNPLGLAYSGLYNLIPNANGDVIIKSWQVEEKETIAYAKFGIDSVVAGIPVSGNFGLQVVYTDQSSTAYRVSGSGSTAKLTQFTDGDKYYEALPSLNLSLQVAEGQMVRLAASRSLSRPRMDDMRASQSYSFNEAKNAAWTSSSALKDSPWSSSGGNPKLRPWIADGFDVSYERYLTKQSYFAAAVFYKYLESFVFDNAIVNSYAGLPTSSTATPKTTTGLASSKDNGSAGSIQGIEFSGAASFGMIHPMLEGFGATASYTYTDSSIKPPQTSKAIPVPGLSHNVSNLTIYYEKAGFSARISDRIRSRYLGEVSGFGNGRDFNVIKGESILDAQIGYSFDDGPLKGLSMVLQANNLNDEPFTAYTSNNPSSYDKNQIRDYQHYGRTYLFGLNYKM